MASVDFSNDVKLANAMAALSVADRGRCVARAHGDGTFTVEAPDALESALRADHPPAPPPPPAPVTRAQAKIQLLRAGHLDQVRTLLETSKAENAAEMRLWFEEALTWEYDNPYVIAVAGELGLSDEQRAELFRAAAQIAA